MDTELLVDNQIADGQSLIEQLIKDNFRVSAAFWVKSTEEGSWQLYIASPDVDSTKPNEAYQKVYYSLDSISDSTISTVDINLLNSENPAAKAAVVQRNRARAKKGLKYYGKRLGNLAVKDAYIYPELEIPLRQSFLVTYVRQGQTNKWNATTRKKEFYRGHQALGAVSYSTAQWLGDEKEDENFAHVYVMVEVSSGVDESAIIANPVMMIHLGEQAQLTADELFKGKHPDATVVHEPLMLSFD
jgi:hypothetical protein